MALIIVPGPLNKTLFTNVSTDISMDVVNISQNTNTTLVVETPDPSDYFNIQKEHIYRIIPPILIVWGVVGNLLTIAVILRQMRRLTSTSLYLLTLALSDCVVLLCAPLQRWLLYMWRIDVRHLSSIGCKFHKFFTYASLHWSAWLLAAVTLERAISVVNPYKVKRRCNLKVAGVFVGLIFACIAGLNSHFFFGYGQRMYGGRLYECIATSDKYFKFMHNIWPWVDFTVVFLLPFMCLLICNIIIIFRLATTKRKRKKLVLSQSQKQRRSTNTESRSISVMLVLLSIIFFVFTTPACVFYIYYPYGVEAIMKMNDSTKVKEAMTYLVFWEAVVSMFAYCNSCLNFVMYVFSGRKFRRELKAIFTCTKSESDAVFSSTRTSMTSINRTSRLSTLTESDTQQHISAISSEMATASSIM